MINSYKGRTGYRTSSRRTSDPGLTDWCRSNAFVIKGSEPVLVIRGRWCRAASYACPAVGHRSNDLKWICLLIRTSTTSQSASTARRNPQLQGDDDGSRRRIMTCPPPLR